MVYCEMTRLSDHPDGHKIRIFDDAHSTPLTFADVFAGPSSRACGIALFSELSSSPHEGFYWETPPVTPRTFSRLPFECVIIDDGGALGSADPDGAAFAEHFSANADTVTFPNLGGDALLVAPTPRGGAPDAAYAHFAAFLRGVGDQQKEALWDAMAEAVANEARKKRPPMWISTSGRGVAWLHIRIDNVPKYYQYRPYKERIDDGRGADQDQ